MPDYARPFAGACWFDVLTRGEVLPGLAQTTLLHAGPPYHGAPPAPVLQAAVQAATFEGIATDAGQARQLLMQGALRLEPAQDHGVVTPLAQVISASMPLVAVRQGSAVGYAAVIEGPSPALRFGSQSPETLQRLRHLDARTAGANGALAVAIRPLDEILANSLPMNPAFVLALLMAAALGAVGDSAVIDACGLGGQALAAAPQVATEWRALLPADALTRRERIVSEGTGIISAGRVARHRLAPLVNLAILDATGAQGLIGRGFYEVPPGLFGPARRAA